MNLKKGAALLLASLLLLCTGCFGNGDGNSFTPLESSSTILNSGVDTGGSTIQPQALYGDFVYPDNPLDDLKNYLAADIENRGLPLRLGDTMEHTESWANAMLFTAYFTDHHNACVFSFASNNAYGMNDFYAVDGKDNPSFTIALKDPDNAEDMVLILTSVIMYLSPGTSESEAQQLAMGLDDSITVDGYSIPKDIGGYQVQAHYTNPHAFFSTPEFLSQYGVSVYALKYIWGRGIDLSIYTEMTSETDYAILSNMNSPNAGTVYGEFTVVDWWYHYEPVHGDPYLYVIACSPYGTEYRLMVNPLQNPYEFGIGEEYILVVGYYHQPTIIYAIQHTGA